jgi:hypothetical protein
MVEPGCEFGRTFVGFAFGARLPFLHRVRSMSQAWNCSFSRELRVARGEALFLLIFKVSIHLPGSSKASWKIGARKIAANIPQ